MDRERDRHISGDVALAGLDRGRRPLREGRRAVVDRLRGGALLDDGRDRADAEPTGMRRARAPSRVRSRRRARAPGGRARLRPTASMTGRRPCSRPRATAASTSAPAPAISDFADTVFWALYPVTLPCSFVCGKSETCWVCRSSPPACFSAATTAFIVFELASSAAAAVAPSVRTPADTVASSGTAVTTPWPDRRHQVGLRGVAARGFGPARRRSGRRPPGAPAPRAEGTRVVS